MQAQIKSPEGVSPGLHDKLEDNIMVGAPPDVKKELVFSPPDKKDTMIFERDFEEKKKDGGSGGSNGGIDAEPFKFLDDREDLDDELFE